MFPAEILNDVASIARGAGEIILRHFAAPVPTSVKSSRIDIVTAADTEAEAYIVRELVQRFPDHHIVGEEGGGQGAPATAAPYHWYVDPIDGTVNFASKLPHFCTSIALTAPDRQGQGYKGAVLPVRHVQGLEPAERLHPIWRADKKKGRSSLRP